METTAMALSGAPAPRQRSVFPSRVRDRCRVFQKIVPRRPPSLTVISPKAARASFRKALQASRARGRGWEALAYFESALILDVLYRHGEALPLYRSYYGLGLGFIGGNLAKGLELCREAAEDAPYDAEVFLNLGRLERRAGNRSEAHRALIRGFHLADDKEVFQDYLDRLDPKPAKVLRLSRPRLLSRLAGRLTEIAGLF